MDEAKLAEQVVNHLLETPLDEPVLVIDGKHYRAAELSGLFFSGETGRLARQFVSQVTQRTDQVLMLVFHEFHSRSELVASGHEIQDAAIEHVVEAKVPPDWTYYRVTVEGGMYDVPPPSPYYSEGE